MSDIIILDRNVYGRLYNPEKDRFSGGLGDIAFSKGITPDRQKRLDKFVKLGLSDSNLKDTSIYGFYYIDNNEFTAVHTQLMKKNEDTNRGVPIFTEYILITNDQLELINWDLNSVFNLFSDYPENFLFEKVRADLDQYRINIIDESQIDSSYTNLHSNTVRVGAILSLYLSSSEKLYINSGPDDPRQRLKFLCSLSKAIPRKFRDSFSFEDPLVVWLLPL